MKNKPQILIAVSLLVSGALIFMGMRLGGGGVEGSTDGANVKMDGDRQIVEIQARGGYSPRYTEAKADVKTVLKVVTKGAYDCSSALVIPSIGYNESLPFTGETEIELPAQKRGTVLEGFCSMGMYNFEVKFS